MTSLGDLDGNGVMDLAVGAAAGVIKGITVKILAFGTLTEKEQCTLCTWNTDGTIKSTVTIDKDTTNGPSSTANLIVVMVEQLQTLAI